ncbi:MAG TPA: glycosyltransferase family 2 protein [Elusimicrobiales bacterium]|nr:glycosyltransferase family 2 protein [Elusimicrobiales bacterium]
MITNILNARGYERGLLKKSASSVIQPVFATANLAIRRAALAEIGNFDERCRTGEDVDLCIRLSRTRWELFFEPRAVINHKHRTTLAGLLKQWYHYGRHHPYIFKKHSAKAVEIYYPSATDSGWASLTFSRVLGCPVPLHTVLFLTPFHVVNFIYFGLAVALGFRLYWLAGAAAALRLFLWVYWREMAHARTPRRAGYSLIRYLLNWTYVAGAFFGGLPIGVLYLEATRDSTPAV